MVFTVSITYCSCVGIFFHCSLFVCCKHTRMCLPSVRQGLRSRLNCFTLSLLLFFGPKSPALLIPFNPTFQVVFLFIPPTSTTSTFLFLDLKCSQTDLFFVIRPFHNSDQITGTSVSRLF